MKQIIIIVLILVAWTSQAQELNANWTITSYVGIKSVSWTRDKMSSPIEISPTHGKQSGLLPMVGVLVSHQLSPNYEIYMKAEGFTGHTRLEGEYGIDTYGIEERVSVRDQKVKWLGMGLEAGVSRTFPVGEQISLKPEISVAYNHWRTIPPRLENPLIVGYTSHFNWYRTGLGMSLHWQLSPTQRLYFTPSLRVPLSMQRTVHNFQTVDHFQALQEQIAQQGYPETLGMDGAKQTIQRIWNAKNWKDKRLSAKLGYRAELGWQQNYFRAAIVIENLVIDSSISNPTYKGLFSSLCLGVPIQLAKRKPSEAGYFMRSTTSKK